MSELKKPLNEYKKDTFIKEVKKNLDANLNEKTRSRVDNKNITQVCTDIFEHAVYSKQPISMAINRARRDINKSIIDADIIKEGFYLGGQDQLNPKKEKVAQRQSVIFFDEANDELFEMTVFGHSPNRIVDGKKTQETDAFEFGKKYRMYGKPFEAFGTVTGSFAEEIEGKLDTSVFFDFLERNAISPSELGTEHIYSLVVLSSVITYFENLEILGEDKTKEKITLLDSKKNIILDEDGLPRKGYPITKIGSYPIVTSRLDDEPHVPCFTGRVKLIREEIDEGDDEFKNYAELIFYPQRLGDTHVSMAGLSDILEVDGALEYPAIEQGEMLVDALMNRDVYAVGRLVQYNIDTKDNPIYWAKINTVLMTDNAEMDYSLKNIVVDVITDATIGSSSSEELVGVSVEHKKDLSELISSNTVKMIGPTNYKELKEAGRLNEFAWISDSYESAINKLLKDDGRFSL